MTGTQITLDVIMAQAFHRGQWKDFQIISLDADDIGAELDDIAAFEVKWETPYANKPLRAVRRTTIETLLPR